MINRLINLITAVRYCLSSRFRIKSLNIHPSASIGKNVSIMRGAVLAASSKIGNNSELYHGVILGKNVEVGDFTSINNSTKVEVGKIGHFCSIGVDVIIGPGIHPLHNITTSTLYIKYLGLSLNGQLKDPPIIGNDVWIGSRSIIMPGVHVADGAVIGSNAVVTKDVPPYAIVAGVPAKIIKYRFDESTISQIVKLNIWDNYHGNEFFIKEMMKMEDHFIDKLHEQ